MVPVPDSVRADSQGGPAPRTLGKYEILELLAVGGMAEILLARSIGIEGFVKHVVIKRILPQFASEERFVSMFADEARLAACLQHQNIAQVYDIGVDGGEYFFAMEYVHGQDVGTVLREVTSRGQRLPLAEALTIAAGIASGLAYAHERNGPDGQPLGVVHRDISPSNVLVSYEGGIKLVDFGIARASIRSTETRTGAVKGKLSYMSPEQCLGEELNHRSDIFSLGVVLYELTTSARMFRYKADDSDYLVMNRIVTGKVVPPTDHLSNYPPALQAIVLKAVAREPAERYQSARELLVDLERFAGEAGIPLSSSALSRYLIKVFGRRPEPWREEAESSDAAPAAVGPTGLAGDHDGMDSADDLDDLDALDDDTVAEPLDDPHRALEKSPQVEPWGLPEELSPDDVPNDSPNDVPNDSVAGPPATFESLGFPASRVSDIHSSPGVQPPPVGEPSGSLSEAWFAGAPESEVSAVREPARSRRRMAIAALVAVIALAGTAGAFYATSSMEASRASTAPADNRAGPPGDPGSEPAAGKTPQPDVEREARPAAKPADGSRGEPAAGPIGDKNTEPETPPATSPPEPGQDEEQGDTAENPDSTGDANGEPGSADGEPESADDEPAAREPGDLESGEEPGADSKDEAQPSKRKRSPRSKRTRSKPAKKRRPKAKPPRKRVNDLIDTRW